MRPSRYTTARWRSKRPPSAPHHPNLALGLNNLALLHYERGAYLEAQTLLRRALAIEEEAYGPDDPTLIVTLQNYARVRARSWAAKPRPTSWTPGRRRSPAAPGSSSPRSTARGRAGARRRTPLPPRRGYPRHRRRGPRLRERYRRWRRRVAPAPYLPGRHRRAAPTGRVPGHDAPMVTSRSRRRAAPRSPRPGPRPAGTDPRW